MKALQHKNEIESTLALEPSALTQLPPPTLAIYVLYTVKSSKRDLHNCEGLYTTLLSCNGTTKFCITTCLIYNEGHLNSH